MIVLACHHRAVDDFVVPCVRSLRHWMPEERVVVVDSASPDRSYMPVVRELGAEVAEIENRHYETGAWWYAYFHFPEEAFFYFLHDSVLVTASLHAYRERPFTAVGYMDTWSGCDQRHIDRVHVLMQRTAYVVPPKFPALFGSMFFCARAVLTPMVGRGLPTVLPVDKFEAECLERVWGIALQAEGHDVLANSLRSPQGSLSETTSLPLIKRYGRRT